MYLEIEGAERYRAALYIRLSREDETDGPSESVSNQRAMLEDFARQRGVPVAGLYVDDGWSGTSFDRPEFRRMLRDIEAGRVNMVITKDDCVIKALTPQTLENRHFSGIGTEFRAIWRPQRAAHIIGTS